MNHESLPDHIKKDYDSAVKLGRNRKWRVAIATAAVLGTLVAIEARRRGNEAQISSEPDQENSIERIKSTFNRLKRAGENPSDTFIELPEASEQNQLITRAAQAMTREPNPLILPVPPINRVREWRFFGGISLLEVQFTYAPDETNPRSLWQHTRLAIVGRNNSIRELHPLLPQRPELVHEILKKFTLGQAAVEANTRLIKQ